ncbi:hypothetical protein AB0D57_40905 [Streptomyces sp. NPDC048275]|uniref:hypothetical protein n=1 Tax=Streptomyces sp. NPDC048275 TaxID=3155629 RepID=UPI0033DA5788
MADEHYKWLDREAAERLLRGEPLDAVDADTQGRADRLAEALGALAAEPALSSAELPGEAAALAAFRKTRTAKNGEAAELGRRGRAHAAPHSSDAGLVRLGRPVPGGSRARWRRPVRFGLAAALAAGMIGGVAFAAGTGVLPTPFRDDSPNPAATVSAAVTPDRPLVSPSPGATRTDGSAAPLPGATTSGSPGSGSSTGSSSGSSGSSGSSQDEARGGATASGQPGSFGAGASGRSSEWWSRARLSCRDVLDGKALEADRKRVLENAAGGGGRVKAYCKVILGQADGSIGQDRSDRSDQDTGDDDQDSGSGSGGDSGGEDDAHHIRPGSQAHHGDDGIFTPASPSAMASLLPRKLTSPSPVVSTPTAVPSPAVPSPSYSALPLL